MLIIISVFKSVKTGYNSSVNFIVAGDGQERSQLCELLVTGLQPIRQQGHSPSTISRLSNVE